MVKSLISIGISVLLLAGIAIFEWIYVANQFSGFEEELQTLSLKIDNETANTEDAKSVQKSWDRRKDQLFVWVPHNDITRIDDYLAETAGFLSEQNFELARARLDIVLHLAECLPGSYRPTLENVL